MADHPHILVIEGNTADACAAMEALCGITSAGRYRTALLNAVPGATVDIIVAAEADAELPKGMALEDYDGVAIGGSSLHVQDAPSDPRVSRQIDLVRAALDAGQPVLGSCWGLQVAAMATGGGVDGSPHGREIGVARKIALTPAGRGHRMYEGKNGAFDSLCVHYDEVTHLPPGAVVLASNGHSAVQAACFDYGQRGAQGTFWGVQYHPEFDFAFMAAIYERDAKALVDGGFCADEAAVAALSGQYRSLQQNPNQPDVAWHMGLDADVLDTAIREREIANWVRHQVLPRVGR